MSDQEQGEAAAAAYSSPISSPPPPDSGAAAGTDEQNHDGNNNTNDGDVTTNAADTSAAPVAAEARGGDDNIDSNNNNNNEDGGEETTHADEGSAAADGTNKGEEGEAGEQKKEEEEEGGENTTRDRSNHKHSDDGANNNSSGTTTTNKQQQAHSTALSTTTNNNNKTNSSKKGSSRYKKSGTDLIREAEAASYVVGGAGYTTGQHTDAMQRTIPEENYIFRNHKCHARATYHGPIFIPEDTHVACSRCGGPVDPVNREQIPNFLHHLPVARDDGRNFPSAFTAGGGGAMYARQQNKNNKKKQQHQRGGGSDARPADKDPNKSDGVLYFHLQCLACFLCGKRAAEHVSEVFIGVENQPLCSDCHFIKGHNFRVRVEEAEARGVVLGAVPNPRKITEVFQKDEKYRRQVAQHYLANATIPGAAAARTTAPSLYVTAGLHNTRNTTKRGFALLQRQQYYTQNDCNNLLLAGPGADADEQEEGEGGAGSRRLIEQRHPLSGQTPRLRPAAAAYLRDVARQNNNSAANNSYNSNATLGGGTINPAVLRGVTASRGGSRGGTEVGAITNGANPSVPRLT